MEEFRARAQIYKNLPAIIALSNSLYSREKNVRLYHT